MMVTPNEYLDARRPEWIDAEVLGLVRYDKTAGIVVVSDECADVVMRLRAAAGSALGEVRDPSGHA